MMSTSAAAAALILLLTPPILPPLWAALGEPAATAEHDRVMMKGQRQSRSAQGYSVESITVAGMLVKEYVSADGMIFAVVWEGTGVPDLRLLLGAYFEEYRTALTEARQRTPRVRQPFRMRSERLVVERAGHSRALWGRAYLPSQLPGGIRPEDIQ
jgi:hypothetical protein